MLMSLWFIFADKIHSQQVRWCSGQVNFPSTGDGRSDQIPAPCSIAGLAKYSQWCRTLLSFRWNRTIINTVIGSWLTLIGERLNLCLSQKARLNRTRTCRYVLLANTRLTNHAWFGQGDLQRRNVESANHCTKVVVLEANSWYRSKHVRISKQGGWISSVTFYHCLQHTE
jgi:hypothetical protein